MTTELISIASLITDNLQIRVEMVEECVEDYAASYRENPGEMPPVLVYHDPTCDKYYLADGFHRVAAQHLNGSDTITAEVREGTFEDALRAALQANAKNALRRTNADKRHALEVAWANWDTLYRDLPRTTEDGRPSVRQLSEITSTSVGLCHKFIEESGVFTVNTPPVSKVTGKPLLTTTANIKTASALTTTRDHLEERNASVSALLKQGKDRYGLDIPAALLDAFVSHEPQAFMRDLGVIRSALEKKRLEGSLAFAHSIAYAMRDLDAAIRDLRQGAVHCVCRMCRGTGCGSCSHLGFQTKLQYDRLPTEFKAEGV